MSSAVVQGFDSLRLLNLDNNCIAEWEEIMKLSQLRRLVIGKREIVTSNQLLLNFFVSLLSRVVLSLVIG